jgi:hypothetical protein
LGIESLGILNRSPPANAAGDVLIFGIFTETVDAASGRTPEGGDQTDVRDAGRVAGAAGAVLG